MKTPTLQWQTPEPLWARFGVDTATAVGSEDQYRPAILRFATDAFMDQMLATLANDPAALSSLLARPETWRSPPRGDPPFSTAPGPAAPAGELIARIPLPRTARAAARGLMRRRARSRIAPVPAKQLIPEKTQVRELPLKLYQPAHQRYYLVSASLVCPQVGLPDRTVTRSGQEQVGYVLRRLLPETVGTDQAAGTSAPIHEHAFVPGAHGARWQRVSTDGNDAVLCPGEEILPLFPLAFNDAADHNRTIWTGLVPVGRREEYLSTAVDPRVTTLATAQRRALTTSTETSPASSTRARLAQLQTEVVEPWKNLIRTVFQAKAALDDTRLEPKESNDDRIKRVKRLNQQWQMQSWLILLDLADYLIVHLPALWRAIKDGAAPTTGSPIATLYQWLDGADNNSALEDAIVEDTDKPIKTSLREALAAIAEDDVRTGLEEVETLYTEQTKDSPLWPGFHFLLAGLDLTRTDTGIDSARIDPAASGAFLDLEDLPANGSMPDLKGLSPEAAPVPPADSLPPTARIHTDHLDRLMAQIARTLEPSPETLAPPLPFALQLRDALFETLGGDGDWLVARCVHLDRDCGPLASPTLSAPSQRFQLASFFDPDAPARPIRITLPTDTTPAGLRRHNRGTAFVISDILCGQIQRAKGLGLVDLVRSVLPWPLHKDLSLGSDGKCGASGGVDIGMICSLSIPIITICALILLIIIVSLLDIIFHWLPYLIFCFPLPGLRGKGGNSS